MEFLINYKNILWIFFLFDRTLYVHVYKYLVYVLFLSVLIYNVSLSLFLSLSLSIVIYRQDFGVWIINKELFSIF